jgi:hypothetical protein
VRRTRNTALNEINRGKENMIMNTTLYLFFCLEDGDSAFL